MSETKWTWQQAILDSDLAPTTRHVLLTIGCYMNQLGEGSYPSMRTLAVKTGLSARAVCTHVEKAAKAGWIRIAAHGFAGTKWRRNEYVACWPGKGEAPREEKMLPAISQEQQQKIRARRKVANDIAKGNIQKKVCEICGNPTAEAHHHDYTKPRDIHWLCRLHHKRLHMLAKAVEPRSTRLEGLLNHVQKAVEPDDKRLLNHVQRNISVNLSVEKDAQARATQGAALARRQKPGDEMVDAHSLGELVKMLTKGSA